ncbi:methyltransferase [Legionella sp. D16C41]|uniref:class I SAM-dependent methyltransferase n=1 Tax=Legionella sp. D16C41 TaxID=3402688 RepID=UPI003AF7C72D
MSMYDSNEFFKTYFANTSEKNTLIDLMNARFFPPKESFNILDLGCHDGALIKKIFAAYANRMPANISLTGVDPSFEALLRYTKNQLDIPAQINIFMDTAENYFIQRPKEEHFDWVIASQCLYWSPDLPYIVNKIANCAGAGLIVLRGQRGIYEIQSHFKHYIGNSNEQFYTADEIESALLNQAIPFEKELKTTYIQLPAPGSIEMKWLIAFFLQQDEKKINDDICHEVEAWIFARNAKKITHDVYFFWLGKAILRANNEQLLYKVELI